MPTIKDVAASAGVSIKTVSRVINGEPGVAEPTRQHINTIIQQLGYVPNLSAQRLKRGKSRLLALILPRVESPYAMKLFSCILLETRKRDYSVLALENQPGAPSHTAEYIEHVIKNHQVDGLIIAPPGVDNLDLLHFIQANNIAYVIIHPNILNEHPLSVEPTDRIGANEATRYLISLGHKRIAHITCLKTERFSQERKIGYLEAMENAGLDIMEHLIYQGDNSLECGHRAAEYLLNLPDPPTAIFAGNDEMAVGAILSALYMGLQIPGDLSVIGFDDAPISEQVFPRLTTVAQPLPEIARVSVEKLVELIDQRDVTPHHTQIPTRLVLRESCGIPTRN